MKRTISFVTALALLLCLFVVPSAASEPFTIIKQPQSSTYSETAVVHLTTTVFGPNVRCKWYLHYNGKDYPVFGDDVMDPWESYVGSYSPYSETKGDTTVFGCWFEGMLKELDGCYIYAALEDGHFDATTSKAYISIVEGAPLPPEIDVPASMEVGLGQPLDLYCGAKAPDGSKLSYVWYETSTGDLPGIVAIDRGAETADTLRVDTSTAGTRYYVCGVNTAKGGSGYSGVISVTVKGAEAGKEENALPFTDVPADAPYAKAVKWVYEKGIMGGYNATTFGSNDNLNRAMVVQVLYNKEGKPSDTRNHDFVDVKANDWFNNAVSWASRNGIVGGYGNGKFGPNDSVTLEQVAVILYNYAGKPSTSGDVSGLGAHSSWAANALSWCLDKGVLEDVPFGKVTDLATRAQTAQMLVNYLSK